MPDKPSPTAKQPTKPKPCPFCGKINGGYDGAIAFRCHSCGASGPDFQAEQNAAISAWNHRTSDLLKTGLKIQAWVRELYIHLNERDLCSYTEEGLREDMDAFDTAIAKELGETIDDNA